MDCTRALSAYVYTPYAKYLVAVIWRGGVECSSYVKWLCTYSYTSKLCYIYYLYIYAVL